MATASAYEYRKRLQNLNFIPKIGITKEKWEIHSVILPEENIDFDKECERLNRIMDTQDCVNIFLCEGAGLETIIKETEKEGGEILRDAFGHVRLDELNPGQWFAKQFSKRLKANKVLVQKSGYFSRSSKPNHKDLDLIFELADYAVTVQLTGLAVLLVGMKTKKIN